MYFIFITLPLAQTILLTSSCTQEKQLIFLFQNYFGDKKYIYQYLTNFNVSSNKKQFNFYFPIFGNLINDLKSTLNILTIISSCFSLNL